MIAARPKEAGEPQEEPMEHSCRQNRRKTALPFICQACERDRVIRERLEVAGEWALLLLGGLAALAVAAIAGT